VSNGSLIIEAKKENYSGNTWTSARIKTQEKRSFKYGKIEFRAKLPTGRGPWPAAWLLGTNISSVSWPDCGEIDVMEWRAGTNGSTSDMNTVGHALHSKNRNGVSGTPLEPARTPVTNSSTQFHTYAVLWETNKITFSVDGINGTPLTPVDQPAFQKEFFLILNLAMGGNYVGGYIDDSLNEATYEVDYVRVYQSNSASVASDITPPTITLLGSNPALVNWGATYSDAGATAFDAGDNTNVSVISNNPVNTAVPGSYLVTYTATDSSSNTATANRTVKVSMSNGGTNRGTDGLTDALRYAYGGTGTSPISTSLLPSNSISGSNLVLTYFARTNSNVTLTPVVSTDLSVTNSWTNSGVSNLLLSNITNNGTVLEKRQATTPVSGSKKFLKLNVLFINP
jgi:beta-glucanase (GH16 family)